MYIEFSHYRKLLQEYERLESDNFNEAYRILKQATALSDYYGELYAKAKKLLVESEFNFKQVKARVSHGIAPTKPTEGERQALFSDEVGEAHKTYTDALYQERTMENITATIDKIYFDSKNIWDKGNKDYRSKGSV